MSDKPELVQTLVVDGDVLAYRAAFSAADDGPAKACAKVDSLMKYIIDQTLWISDGSDYEVYLTGDNNFRYGVATTYTYKGNRKSENKPVYLPNARAHIIDKWGAKVIHGQEADDQMAIDATFGDPETTVIASIDKDMLQVNCWHFNFGKGRWDYSTKEEGLRFFYQQLLTGDTVDNIIGLYRVGPVKANKILGDTYDEELMYERTLEAYGGNKERVLENARLLWLRRFEGQMWVPPHEREKETSK